jgi:hypothetical protein
MKNGSLVIAVLGIIALAVLFFIFRSNQTATQINQFQSPAASIEESTGSGMQSSKKVFELVVKDNKLVSGSETLTVNQGDNVTIKITSDTDGELHLHGYDKSVEFKKGAMSELSFVAALTGHFPFELEDTKTEIGALEVLPK